MAFNPDEYLRKNKSVFDPDAYLAKQEKADKGDGAFQAGLEAYGNTATMGYLPQAQAIAGKLMPDPNKDLDADLRKQGFTISQPKSKSYLELRDENLKRQEKQATDYPTATKVGTGLGMVGASLIGSKIGGAANGAASIGDRFLKAGKMGAAYGALTNPGDVEGEISPLQPVDRGINAAIGLGTGLASQGLVEGASKLGSGISSWLNKKSGEKAFAAIGANKSDMKFLGPEGVEKLGREALDKKIVTPLSTPKSILAKAEKAKESAGDKIGKIIKMADDADAPKIDGTKLGLDLLNDAEVLAARKTPEMGAMANAAERSAEALAVNGEMTLKQAHELRRGIDRSIKFNRKRSELPPGTQEVLYKARDSLNAAINDGVNESVGQGTDVLKKLNAEYSKLSRVQQIAENRVAANSANRAVGLTDTIAAAAGGMIGSEIGGTEGSIIGSLVGGALNKSGRTFGASLQATGFDRASKILAKSPALEQFASQNPLRFQVLANQIRDVFSGKKKFESMEGHPIFKKEIIGTFKERPELIESIIDEKLKREMYKKVGREPSGIVPPKK